MNTRPADISKIETWNPIILPNISDLNKIENYLANNGYKAFIKSLKIEPKDIIEEVKKSNLRGRGGACFYTGLKWSFMPQNSDKPKYLCVNGDEAEPGTFKDRFIIEHNPHLLIEGILIACYAMQIKTAYVYIRGEYQKWIKILQSAIDDSYKHGFIGQNILGTNFSTDIVIHKGAGAYICGEESALMNSIQGERGYPRIKPPFPAQSGLWGCPTTINNVETIANIPIIINKGWEWYSKIGAEKHPGPILVGVSGHVNNPGVFEMPTGEPILEIIYKWAGGIIDNKSIKAVIPGGSSTTVLRGDQLEGIRFDAESLKKIGSSIGTAGIIVMNEDANLLSVLTRIAEFYYHESCGQCTPCREGTDWLYKILKRISDKKNATEEDLDLLLSVASNIEGNTICALGDAAAIPIKSFIKNFKNEILANMK